MSEKKTYTVHDVAKKAGVSIKTVSRVLNNESSVGERYRLKVQNAVAELGYLPDINARRLRTGQSYIICLIYFDYDANSYVNRLISGATKACDAAGYDLIIRPVDPDDEDSIVEQIHHLANRAKPDGYILPPPLSDRQDIIEAIAQHNKPLVRILPMDLDEETCVYCDIKTGVKAGIKHLLSSGHRRIALLNAETVHGGLWRFEAYREAHEEAHIPIDDALITRTYMSDDDYRITIQKMLSMQDRPTAIFTFNDYVATLVYRVANQMHLKIPYDLSVIGFDDDPISKNLWPALSTIHQPSVNLGKAAAQKLIYSLILNQPEPERPNLTCSYLQRSSCGPLL